MDKVLLVATLADTIDSKNPALAAALQKYAGHAQADAFALQDVADPIRKLLQEQPEFEGNIMINLGSVHMSLLMLLPQYLLARAKMVDCDDAVHWLENMLAIEEAPARVIMPVWGIQIESPIDLTPTIQLLPLKELPNSLNRRWLEEIRLPGFGTPFYTLQPPIAALAAKTKVAPLIYNSRDGAPSDDTSSTDLLAEVRLCLTLVGPSAIIPAYQWLQFDDPDIAVLARFTGGWAGPVEIQPATLTSYGEFDPARAAALVSRYLNIQGSVRARIRAALDRFDRGMRRHNPGDTAVEIAFALDSLLGDGEGELTWKVGLRAALLAGGSKAEKMERRAIVHALYRLRSKVAHTGNVPSVVEKREYGKIMPDQLTKEGTIAAAKVIAAAIDRGSLPDWFEEELGVV
jgi:Apea-like HEPN